MKIKKLKLRPRRIEQIGPCTAEIAAVLTCWSNSSVDSPACKKSVEALTECMRNATRKILVKSKDDEIIKQINSIKYCMKIFDISSIIILSIKDDIKDSDISLKDK
ncbi:6252_t:CDS:2 [Scutellospora calospora]|uniref:6252_t:CDS:1 n=1 Tax=Scutellospora calospora TaxID=85575 RepID=A0ACA9JZQ2_9GLOM|nr:6252_t:CDS:2 [Scutellospora calospora]